MSMMRCSFESAELKCLQYWAHRGQYLSPVDQPIVPVLQSSAVVKYRQVEIVSRFKVEKSDARSRYRRLKSLS